MADDAHPQTDEPVNLLALGRYLCSFAWIRLLISRSTDGGGIRGLSELLILDEIMKRVQDELKLQELPKPCEYFHLIGGTSTLTWHRILTVVVSRCSHHP